MKKLLAMLMAAAMILSLAACGSGSGGGSSAPAETPAQSAPAVEESAPAAETPAVEAGSDIQARLDAGEEVMVGYAVNTLSNPALKQTIDNVAGFLEELGCTVSVAACEGDTTLMISQVENFIEMGVDCLIVAPIDHIMRTRSEFSI